MTPLLILLPLLVSLARGEYDLLERKALPQVPARLRAIRESLIDPSMYQEVMFHLMSYFLPTDSDNPLCSNHSSLLQVAFLEDQLWALQMMDASTKLGDGVLQGNMQGLGSFDECLSVVAPHQRFQGQLCVVQTRGILPPAVPNSETSEFSIINALPMDMTLSVCVPSSCRAEDVAEHWRLVAEEINGTATVSPSDCSSTGDTQPGTQAWAALAVLAALCFLVLASTCYDYSVNHQPTKEQRILVCFSVHGSLRGLFHPVSRVDSLDVLDGIRVLAISWIVLGHRFEQSLQVPTLSLLATEKYTTAWFMSPVLNMMLAVELFFLLSGCLLAYHFLQSRLRAERFNLIHFYYKRYIRLTPALALVMLLEGCLMLHTADGPLWKRLIGHRVGSCEQYWWTSLLYISNYVNPYRICIVQTWYLSADMQLYLLSPLLLVPLARRPRRGLALLAACYLATTTAAFCNALYYQLPAGATVTLTKKTEQNHGLEYVKTHVRAASWLTGLALGYVLHCCHNTDHKWNICKKAIRGSWLLCVSLCVASVYSIVPFQSLTYEYSPLVDSLHIALHRNCFSLGAAGIILLCVLGKGGCVQDFLSWKGFRPLATLSYGVYLSHMGLQAVGLARIRQPYSLDMFNMIMAFMSDLLLANLAAILIYIFVEGPFWEIGKWLYNPRKEAKPTSERHPVENINIEDEKSVL